MVLILSYKILQRITTLTFTNPSCPILINSLILMLHTTESRVSNVNSTICHTLDMPSAKSQPLISSYSQHSIIKLVVKDPLLFFHHSPHFFPNKNLFQAHSPHLSYFNNLLISFLDFVFLFFQINSAGLIFLKENSNIKFCKSTSHLPKDKVQTGHLP